MRLNCQRQSPVYCLVLAVSIADWDKHIITYSEILALSSYSKSELNKAVYCVCVCNPHMDKIIDLVHTGPTKISWNPGASFLQLSRLSLLIRQENEAFRRRWGYDNIPAPVRVYGKKSNPKRPVIVTFSNTSGLVWTELKYLMRFQSETSVFKFI